MLQHSEAKVTLLKLYLEQYLNILSMSKFIDDVKIYDLFCGEGIYENGGKGSPIVILEVIKEIYFSRKSRNLSTDKFDVKLNDKEEWKILKLKNEIASRNLHYAEIGSLDITNEQYHTILPKTIAEINRLKKEKAFVFIDPYGYKEVKVADIKGLLKSHRAEVLLFLPTQFMFRFESKGTPECLVDFISELMPVEEWPSSETGIGFIDNLTEAFRTSLGPEYFVDSFIITRDKNQFFCLFFFTSHIYGFDRMLEAKWKIDEEDGRGWKYEVPNSLFGQVDVKPNTLRFERKLKEFLKTERTNGELYVFRLKHGHLAAHAYDILLRLQKENKLISLKKDGSPARKSSFYLNYSDYKEDREKIRVKLK